MWLLERTDIAVF